MKLLLDTHIALWAINDPARLTDVERHWIDSAQEVNVSIVAICEIAIKYARRRGRTDDIQLSGREAYDRLVEAGFSFLPITAGHAVAIDTLPRLHGDPFDRMLRHRR